VAPSRDGVTIAISGWNPNLRIVKALPWNKLTRRDGDFYRAVDDLWTYTAQLPEWIKTQRMPPDDLQPALADDAEILGDIQRRRGQDALAIAHYNKAIENRQDLILRDPLKAQLQYQLAMVYEKRLAVADAGDPARGAAVLQQAVEFWQKLISGGRPHQIAWRYLLDFQLRLSDLQLARSGKDAKNLLLPQILLWCDQSHKGPDGPDDRLARYGLRELWARLAATVPGLPGDQKAIDELVEHHPELTVTVGDQYAADKNWERAIAIYGRAITATSGIHHVRKLLALSGAGQPKDDPPLDDAAKAIFRRRALIWLKAELTASTKRFEGSPPRDHSAIARTLEHWKQDPDLAAVREADSLVKLPADERKAWQTLWADVDSLLNRAPTTKVMETKLQPTNSGMLAGMLSRAQELAVSKPDEAVPLLRRALEGYRKTKELDVFSRMLTVTLTVELAQVLVRTGRAAEAEPLFQSALERARKEFNPNQLALGNVLSALGWSLIQQGRWSEVGPVLHESLAIRERLLPDHWTTFNTRSLLGGSLMGQKKYAEAEPLILSGYEGMKAREAAISPPYNKQLLLPEAAERVVKLYEAWGKMDKAAEWRAKLAKPSAEPKPQP
jgi:tetratricopeptide (TPR) repeat protein